VKLVAATIARMSRSYAERLADFVEALRKLVTGAPVKHMDETGSQFIVCSEPALLCSKLTD
jgi:hypothetical protein